MSPFQGPSAEGAQLLPRAAMVLGTEGLKFGSLELVHSVSPECIVLICLVKSWA